MLNRWKHKAGNELDALVAKEFLGWSHDDTEPHHRYWWDEDGDQQIKFFSTDDDEAFKLIQKLRNSGDWCCIDIGTDYHYRWSIKITPGYGLDQDKEDKHEPLLCFEGDNFAEIICNAVLEATRYKASLKLDSTP